jgi:hypothetical protein
MFFVMIWGVVQWYTEGGAGFKTPQNSKVLTKLIRIPNSMENTSITT